MGSLRFVVSHHTGIEVPHFDFMFETAAGSDLATFRCPDWPVDVPTDVLRLRDHRRLYLDYDGQIAGNRGHVSRISEGTLQLIAGTKDLFEVRSTSPASPFHLFFRRDGDEWFACPAEVH